MKYQSALLLTTLLMSPLSFADDPFGFDIDVSPAKMERIKEQLKKKYGEPTDTQKALKALMDTGDWMKEIYNNDRVYSYYWFDKKVGNVGAIGLQAKAKDEYNGRAVLKFEYNNIDACRKREKDKQSDAF